MKGLNRAPELVRQGTFGFCGDETSYQSKPGCITNRDVDFMISPYGCWGIPHKACKEMNIPIITVRENRVVTINPYYESGSGILVETYLEAAGLIMSWRAGVHPDSVLAKLGDTIVNSIGVI